MLGEETGGVRRDAEGKFMKVEGTMTVREDSNRRREETIKNPR